MVRTVSYSRRQARIFQYSNAACGTWCCSDDAPITVQTTLAGRSGWASTANALAEARNPKVLDLPPAVRIRRSAKTVPDLRTSALCGPGRAHFQALS